MKHRLMVWLLAACAACWPTALLAQTASDTASRTGPLHLRHDVKGAVKPLTLDADQIAVWKDATNGRVLLLRGNVLVEQDIVRIRCQQGVAWVEFKDNKIFRVILYAEGGVQLANGSEDSESATGTFEFSTPGDPVILAHPGPIAEKAMTDDPFVKRALAQRGLPPTPAPPVMQQTRYEEKPTDPPPPPAGSRTPAVPTQILGPAVPPIVGPPAGTPPSGPPPITPGPNTPPPLPPPPATAPTPRLPPVIEAPLRRFSVSPRNSVGFQVKREPTNPQDPDRQTWIVTGGAIITIRNGPTIGLVDVEADRAVIWTKGVNTNDLITNTGVPESHTGQELELYLSGNVEMRQQGLKESRTLRADELYYDANRNVAIAAKAQIDFKAPPRFMIADPIVFRADEIVQHAENQYEMFRGEVFSSRLPSDPGLKVYFTQGTIENLLVPRVSPFGFAVTNRQTGQQDQESILYFRGHNNFLELENIPIFYSPYLAGNLLDPLGPIEDLTFGYNKIFGFQFGATLNVYDLLGIQQYEGTKWRLHLDGLTARGPGVGSTFDFAGKDPYDWKGTTYEGSLSGYAIYDDGFDVLGGGRSSDLNIPVWRGRAFWREGVYNLPGGFNVQSQISYLSDRNFLEQYFWREFATGDNQETYVYGKWQNDFYAVTGTVEARLDRPWVTEGERLPEIGGHLITVPLFDEWLTYTSRASAGYYQLRVTSDAGSPPASPQDQYARTGRFDWMQEWDVPFALGPVKFVPYGMLDLASYTQDLNNQEVGRVWGAGGLRASIPFSRIYPNVQSELFNLDGINHKIIASANYFYSNTNVRYTQLPQIDRLNDDATDQAIRDIRPQYQFILPGSVGNLLSGSPLYDPQLYAIRRVILNRVDTLDDMNVMQFDLLQRWQTHRGYPGNEHIVDWMWLDLSASYVPDAKANFNSNFAFLQYDWLWNIGDRTALTSTAWVDPETHGPREYTIGAYLNRPDRTNFFLGFRWIDPLDSRALTAAVTYIFSPKYAMTAATTYDFGTKQAMSSSLMFTRMGSDLEVSVGVTYNALQSNFGALFEIVPNLVPLNRRPAAVGALGQGGLLSH